MLHCFAVYMIVYMAHPVDIHVGQRLRAIRMARGLSQSKLAGKVGLTFQQVQKYESGANRISASKLYDFAQILDASVMDFYKGLDATGSASGRPRKASLAGYKLARSLESIQDEKIRKTIKTLVRQLARQY